MDASIVRAYRLYIWIGSVRYYANRSDTQPLPRVRWSLKSQEYPDHFDYYTTAKIREFYIDQAIKVEEVILSDA